MLAWKEHTHTIERKKERKKEKTTFGGFSESQGIVCGVKQFQRKISPDPRQDLFSISRSFKKLLLFFTLCVVLSFFLNEDEKKKNDQKNDQTSKRQ